MKRTLTVDANITVEDQYEGTMNIVIRMKGDVGEDRVVEEHTGGSYYPVALTENWATVNGELLPNPPELDPQMLYLSERDTTDANKVFLIYRAKDNNSGAVAYRWIAVSLYEYASESGLSPDIWVIANTASVPVADSLTEKIAYRGEKGRELTVAEIDENFRKVANPWNPKRAYRSQDIVYEYDDDTQTCGWYMYYNINRDGTSLIGVRPSEYDNIPADMWIPVGGRGNGGGGGSDTPASNQNPYEYVAYKCFRVKNGHSGGIKFTFGTAEGVDFYNENLLPGSVNMAMCIKSAVPDWNNVFQTPTYSINQNVGIVSIPQVQTTLDSDYVVRVCLYLYKDGDYEALFTFELFKDWESSGK